VIKHKHNIISLTEHSEQQQWKTAEQTHI